MTDEDNGRIELFNPLASFYVEGESDKPDSCSAIVDLYGETGERVRIEYPSSTHVYSMMEMLERAGQDLEFAEEHGITELADRVGRAEEDATLTIPDEFLDE